VDGSPLPAPMSVYLEPTNICNFKCVYCPESFPDFEERSGGLHRLDMTGFDSVARQILEMGRLKVLNFYMMGEPLVNRALPEMIQRAVELGVSERTALTTNATLLDSRVASRLVASGLDYLRVSIYGGTEEASTRRTGSRIKLSRIVDNVRAFRDLRNNEGRNSPFIYVKMIDSGSLDENAAFLETFSPLADEARIEPVMNWNDPEEGNLAQRDRSELLSHDYFRHKKNACTFPFYTLVIHSDLRVSVCCVDWAKEAVVGDLKRESLRSIWFGQALKEFRLTHLRGERQTLAACRNCTYLYTTPDNIDGLVPDLYEARCREAAAKC
jgi:MoaA/NifB/PqqE/SkfB family radical SAM enzyme